MAELINRVANSGLVVINLEHDFPTEEIKVFDLKDYLFHGLILKEKDFRLALKELDWAAYKDQHLCVICTADAIIPQWAYMLIASYAAPVCASLYWGDQDQFLRAYYEKVIAEKDLSEYQEQRVIIKGCSNKPVPASAYMNITAALQPIAKSIMYGEPCSTVPVFKRPRAKK